MLIVPKLFSCTPRSSFMNLQALECGAILMQLAGVARWRQDFLAAKRCPESSPYRLKLPTLSDLHVAPPSLASRGDLAPSSLPSTSGVARRPQPRPSPSRGDLDPAQQ